MLSEQAKAEIAEFKDQYPDPRSVLMPALTTRAERKQGWLSPSVLEEVADLLGIPPAEVRSVASFYTMYNMKPVGKYHLQVCTNISCSLLGAEHIVEYLSKKLGIAEGETTRDGDSL